MNNIGTPKGETLALSEDDVRHVATLAQLALSDEQIKAFAPQLDSILTYAASISEAPGVDDVPETITPFRQENVWREDDEIHEPLGVANVVLNAPAEEANQFRVPKIIGGN